MGGAAVALALPVDASPASLSLATTGTSDTQDRGDVQSASRSVARPAAAPAPAVSAPVDAAPVLPDTVGVAGVKAVAKPKPKPKPTPTETATSDRSSSTSAPRVAVTPSGISAKCGSLGLTTNAARLCTAVQRTFGIDSIGGYRPNAGEHSTGQAVDFMTNSSTGDRIAEFVQANVGTYNVKYIIWEQRYWEPGSSWELMEDRGSATANHYDHVHVTVN